MADDAADISGEANRLYWRTDMAVREIAERLDTSTSTLYRNLVPESAGQPCAACGEELVYANRSARDAGEAECTGCGRIEDVDVGGAAGEPPVPMGPPTGLDTDDALARTRLLSFSAVAFLGLVLGVLAVLLSRRR